jgi:hypothetical protein
VPPHATAYLRYGRTGTYAAAAALEPLVNLGRLRIRTDDGETAHTILDTLLQAVTNAADITIDGLFTSPPTR